MKGRDVDDFCTHNLESNGFNGNANTTSSQTKTTFEDVAKGTRNLFIEGNQGSD
jgi:hypothetical protein